MTNTPARTRVAARPVEHKSTEPASPIVRTEPVLSSPLSTGVLIAVLAVIGALYFAKEVALPIALAIVLKLLPSGPLYE